MNKTIRVLVVDDFASFRQWIRLKLKTSNRIFASEAANGREAIQKARELTPDLILLDLSLPDTNGLDVQQELHEVVPSAKVIFLSGSHNRDVVHRALSNGAEAYLLKADADRDLLPAMEKVLGGETFLSRGLLPTTETQSPSTVFIHQYADAT